MERWAIFRFVLRSQTMVGKVPQVGFGCALPFVWRLRGSLQPLGYGRKRAYTPLNPTLGFGLSGGQNFEVFSMVLPCAPSGSSLGSRVVCLTCKSMSAF